MARSLTIIMLLLLCAGCSSRRVQHLGEERFSPTPKDAEVKLYVNEVRRPHVRIAYVQSKPSSKKDTETRRRQLEELRDLARKNGGQAVMGVKQLKQKARGLVPDERAPFPMVRQGEEFGYFLRGTVIRFVEEPAEGQVDGVDADPATLPEVESTDPDAKLEFDPSPAGLRQPIG